MLLFRSEADVAIWAETNGERRGESVPLPVVWELGKDWYRDRLDARFRGLTPERVSATFHRFGLVSDFWCVP